MSKNNSAKDAVENQIDELSKQIGYTINEYTIGFLADEMQKNENGIFYLSEYQREFIWEPKHISRFVESVVMGLPIPFIFCYANIKTEKLEIIDGSQRLRSLQEFIHGEFRLKKLDRLTELSGKTFNDLSESRQRKIRNRSIRGIVLNEYTDAKARQDLFDRINTSSKPATPAKIRRSAFQGAF
ncbi:MAG: DUF262 domain-containing protein [Planctomycetaceae bacterium]|jgi:uncharacterized protein with ParB-like and HNH nuclease domain|nr:DUF262 domain-containing protein [Planctomycetaceae bacterium]